MASSRSKTGGKSPGFNAPTVFMKFSATTCYRSKSQKHRQAEARQTFARDAPPDAMLGRMLPRTTVLRLSGTGSTREHPPKHRVLMRCFWEWPPRDPKQEAI